MPGINELERIAKDSVIVATDDMCHHGIGYGLSSVDALEINEQGYQFAKRCIEDGYKILKKGNYKQYYDYWMDPSSIGDPTDVAIVLKHLLGEISTEILDLKLVDVSSLFENDVSPSWVAAALVAFDKKNLI